ncbi:MAG TPA: hypothetical protein VGQ37_06620 [Vicinamibacterales bacterium]|jgi:hypothetical protein|nr:hypothetical protein [Vicinamibacterales bacterium]
MPGKRGPGGGRPGGWRPRLTTTGIVAALLFLFVASYRFNTLGGALGGFDNDHFVHLAQAWQVEAGEQPLRDFLDSGLQGARPSLTYELSALAQRLGGRTLRSEAWLTVIGVAAAAALTFVAGAAIVPWPVALVTAVLAALLSPKLYGYPKVLALATISLLVIRYSRTPRWWRIAAMAATTAVAFLFRHDYAIYCGIAALTVLGCSGPSSGWVRLGRAAAYAAITLLLLAPSLYWVERHAGLVAYVQNARSMSAREAQRTTLDWPVPDIHVSEPVRANFEREANSEAWIYYLFVALGWLAALAAAVRMRRGADERDAAMLAIGLMTIPLSLFFLRGSLEARFGDMGPPAAILAAWFCAIAVEGGHRGLGRRAAAALLAAAVLGGTALSIWSLQSVRTELLRAGLLTSPVAVITQFIRVSLELAGLPEGLRRQDATSPSGRAAAYLHDCTAPSDRIMVVSYAPEVGGLSGRLFGGGRATFLPGFYEDERYSRFLMARLGRESVPIVLAEDEPYYAAYPLLAPYLRDVYVEQGRVEIDGGRTLRVLTKRGLVSRPYGPAMLPCFGDAKGPGDGLSQLR